MRSQKSPEPDILHATSVAMLGEHSGCDMFVLFLLFFYSSCFFWRVCDVQEVYRFMCACLSWTWPTGRKSSDRLKYVVEIIHPCFRQGELSELERRRPWLEFNKRRRRATPSRYLIPFRYDWLTLTFSFNAKYRPWHIPCATTTKKFHYDNSSPPVKSGLCWTQNDLTLQAC